MYLRYISIHEGIRFRTELWLLEANDHAVAYLAHVVGMLATGSYTCCGRTSSAERDLIGQVHSAFMSVSKSGGCGDLTFIEFVQKTLNAYVLPR